MGWFVKYSEFSNFKENLKSAFSKIKNDLSVVYKWLAYIRKKEELLDKNQKLVAEFTEKTNKKVVEWVSEVIKTEKENKKRLMEWIKYLENENKTLKKELYETKDYLKKLEEFVEEEINSFRTELKNKPEQNNLQESVLPDSVAEEPSEPKTSANVIMAENLTKAEKGLLRVLYLSKKPLSYEEIARILGLSYGTVKNRLYRIRKLGYRIDFNVDADGEKYFYLNEEEKLKVSGR